jgi:undecaprenyl-diphosphatase
MFEYVVQLAAILAVVVFFWKKLFPFAIKKEEIENAEGGEKQLKTKLTADMGILNLWGKVLVACLPAAVLGILFDDLLEKYLHTPLVIALMLIIYGVAFILIENRNKNRELPLKTTEAISYKHALIIGGFQVLSLIPGTSRSGATIIGALLIGVSRPAGAEFTFFLAIPVMVGASGIKILDFLMKSGMFTGAEIGYLLIGAAVAFLVSLACVELLMNFVKKHNFTVFGWYRIALGALVIILILCSVIPAL